MAIVAYTKKQLLQRIRKHMNNGYPSDSFTTSDKEIILYIDQALAFGAVGQVYAMAKVEGNLVTPEAYLTTYLLVALKQDPISAYWYSTLPQPPVSLPLGYSINRVYFGENGFGQSGDILPIKAKRVGYRNNMPLAPGSRYWVENEKIWVAASDGSPLMGIPIYVQMMKTRTDDELETMALPDDAIENIFSSVIAKLIQRYQQPRDVIVDDLPAGNKSS